MHLLGCCHVVNHWFKRALANSPHDKSFSGCCVHEQGLKACSMIYGSTTPLQSLSELSDMGYHLVFRPLSGKQPP